MPTEFLPESRAGGDCPEYKAAMAKAGRLWPGCWCAEGWRLGKGGRLEGCQESGLKRCQVRCLERGFARRLGARPALPDRDALNLGPGRPVNQGLPPGPSWPGVMKG